MASPARQCENALPPRESAHSSAGPGLPAGRRKDFAPCKACPSRARNNALRSPERAIVVVTHYQRLLDYIVPDYVHVLHDGQIAKTGGKELALELEDRGYGWIADEMAESASV